jgi:purine-nucleoside/S-methyl-5'-thioadenosine phosphorylase / adenosine deaminase
MIVPPGTPGVVFGTRFDGDGRSDADARALLSAEFGISTLWATIRQVHGSRAVYAPEPGFYGDADALVTDVAGLPMAVATADCVPVVLIGERTRAIAHAGWRGVANGVVVEAIDLIERRGDAVKRVVIGPHIGPCCYEVGKEVVEAIGGFASTTRGGAMSVDLALAVRSQVGDVDVVDIGICTLDDGSMASYRQDGTPDRQATVVWLPED